MEVVNNVNLAGLLRMLLARWKTVAVVTVSAIVAGLAITLTTPPTFMATTTLLVDFEQPVQNASEPTLAAILQDSYLTTQMDIMRSRHVVAKAVDNLNLAADPTWLAAFNASESGSPSISDWIIARIIDAITVTSAKNNRLVSISYDHGDPAMAARIANGLAQAYQETNLEFNTQPASREAQEMKLNLAGLRESLEQAQQRLSAYQRERGILLTDERVDVETERLKEIMSQRLLAEADAKALIGRLNQLKEMTSGSGSVEGLQEVQNSELIRDLKRELTVKQGEFTELRQKFGPNHPAYKSGEAEVKALRSQLTTELASITNSIRSQVQQSQARAASFQESEQAQKSKVMELKQARDSLPALVRDQEAAQASYDAGLASYNAFLSKSRISQTNVSVLNPALRPALPKGADLKMTAVIAAILGFILGCCVALVWELSDRRIRSRDDLRGVAEEDAVVGWLPRQG